MLQRNLRGIEGLPDQARRAIEELYDRVESMSARLEALSEAPPLSTQQTQAVQQQVNSLVNNLLTTPLLGSGATDPQLQGVTTGGGTVTNVSLSTSGNLSGSVASSTSTPVIILAFSTTPEFGAVTTSHARFVGYTTSIASPSVAELPNDKDFCIHEDSGLGKMYLAYNQAGVIKKVELT